MSEVAFDAWTVFIDFSLMGLLLVIGQLLRSKVKILQDLLLPSSLIAGILAWILGPDQLSVLPFSNSLGKYSSILIILVFAAMPLGEKGCSFDSKRSIWKMFVNYSGIALAQYGLGMLFGVYFIAKIFNIPSGFGLMLATGFYGGHGTAAAVGDAFESLGWHEAQGLGMTSATVGMIGGIIAGIAIINWATRKGITSFIDSPARLSEEMRTGMIPKDKQKPYGKASVASIAIDPVGFHFAIVLLPSIIGYYCSKLVLSFNPNLKIPQFAWALIIAYLFQFIIKKMGKAEYIDRETINRVSGTATDFLVIAGVGSIKMAIIAKYAIPLALLCAFGFIINLVWVMKFAPMISKKHWFEKSTIVWGSATGTTTTGIMLLRIVDPEFKSHALEETAIALVLNRPIVIALTVMPPIFISRGLEIPIAWVITICLILLLIIDYFLDKWLFLKAN